MKRYPLIVIVFCFTVILSACTNPHIGKPVSYNWNNVCRCDSFPSSCHLELEHFDFNFDVEQQSDAEYFLAGEARNTVTEGATHIYGGTFTFLLVKDGVIIDALDIVPQGNLEQSISFKKSFTAEKEFDGVLVNYSITVR